ncbi:MAG: ATP synthase F1 subunit delta [Bacteroidetes bacterium HGW-Bacteroidetes-23]|uniref:ATP synthase subunit delta n=1 Tax=Flavobacterium azooxidireducens TaxID=1871076 RepID=A0ABY4KJ29_9FLAO|nr:ATP synthase F1 subunit delta [Flavobacterium azooxidireducens]PKP18165.1 MAG: ATP synthase F1 subunit delta [Bacteroidetes bacterium HGW-Bacteroidetes-23]UPQ80856.1 ATP synthase F1 subunit delta [Flavobacterium azooxidireducens]
MRMSRAAIRYAKAIIENAVSNGRADAVNQDMKLINETVNSNEELKLFLVSPVVKPEAKYDALSEIFASVQNDTKGLFLLLKENKRFEILGEIAEQYNAQHDVLNGIEVAKVTTAFPITPDLEAKVLAKIKEFSNKKITLINTVDPSIIGGFILRIGDQQYNASVANRLQQLKREFSN